MTKPLHIYGPFPQSITAKGAAQVFDYSRMVGRYFEPDEKICLIFDNVYYEKLRELPEFAEKYEDVDYMSTYRNEHEVHYNSLRNEFHFHDMPRAREWADTFEEGIKAYEFSEEQIHRHKDGDFTTMRDTII